jgi:AbrB family looped-hinge helix DNA binding protein
MVVRAKLSKEGRLLIPAEFRKELGIKPGDEVAMSIRDGALHVTTHEIALAKLREMFKNGPSVDEFLEWRREEARLEEEKYERWARDARRIGDAGDSEG